jgi:hypothetical protein
MTQKNEAFKQNGINPVNEREGWWGIDTVTNDLYVCIWENEFNNGICRRVRRFGQGAGSVDTQFWNVIQPRVSNGLTKAKGIFIKEVNGIKDYNPTPVDIEFISVNDNRFVVELI